MVSKAVDWLRDAKQNLRIIVEPRDRYVRLAQAQALVSIAESLRGLVELAKKDVDTDQATLMTKLPLPRVECDRCEGVCVHKRYSNASSGWLECTWCKRRWDNAGRLLSRGEPGLQHRGDETTKETKQ